MNSLLVTNCSQLVTLAGPARPRVGPELRELSIVEDGTMFVQDRHIVAVGPRSEIESLATGDTETIDAGGRVVMPGFVDAHTHLVFAGNRADEFEMRSAGMTYQQIAERGGGIRSTVRRTRAATQDELVIAGKKHADWFLQGGTTTVEAKSGYGLTVDDELKLLRAVRTISQTTSLRCISTFLGAHEIPDEYKRRPDDYVDVIVNEMLPLVAKEHLAEFCDVFCEAKVFSVRQAERVLTAAKQHGLGLRVHADQFTSSGAVELAAALNAKTVDHLEQTTTESIALMKKAGVQPVLLPGSVYAIGSQKYAPARAMIEAGLPVVIATDFNPGSSPTASMPMILSLACTQMKMTPAEAVTAATVNAAWSLNRGHDIGSLEPGKIADFVVHDVEDYRELAYFFGGHRAHAVFVAGAKV
ncbi:MAG TPA: imidazolonepropionase [Pseudacidobacterium sp.]|nr:imidazolonepropionase [Pseudacidobacterium sp.]